MTQPPALHAIKEWLSEENPLGLFRGDFSVTDIDPKAWSGHFNYRIETGGKKFVLRFRGPEWGEAQGVIDEYTILKRIEERGVGPKVYYCTEDFFGEPMFFEEYLEGTMLGDIPVDEQKKYFPEVARFIFKINAIPFGERAFPFREPMTSYAKNKNACRERVDFIVRNAQERRLGIELSAFLPRIISLLDSFEERLQRALGETGSVFIFESAHLGHCIKTADGFRFFNWEQVSYGDPSYTLAVFLTSLCGRPDFEGIKSGMLDSYLTERRLSGFEELVRQRILERRISNIVWSAYMSVKRGERITPAERRRKIARLEDILRECGV